MQVGLLRRGRSNRQNAGTLSDVIAIWASVDLANFDNDDFQDAWHGNSRAASLRVHERCSAVTGPAKASRVGRPRSIGAPVDAQYPPLMTLWNRGLGLGGVYRAMMTFTQRHSTQFHTVPHMGWSLLVCHTELHCTLLYDAMPYHTVGRSIGWSVGRTVGQSVGCSCGRAVV